jgi:regulatory protein
MANPEWCADEWLNKAARYCAAAEHCEQEVRRKLLQWKAPKEVHDAVIRYLRDNKYIDDMRYAAAFAHDKVTYNGWSKQKIALSLRALQIDDNAAEEAIDNIDEDTYRAQIMRIISKKADEPAEKIIRSLMQRGFRYEEIQALINEQN